MAEMDVTAKFTADISDMKAKMAQLTTGMQQMQAQTATAGGGFTKLKGLIGGAFGVAAIYAGARAIKSFATESVGAAEEAQKAVLRLDAVAKSMGLLDGALGGTTQRLQDFASELSMQVGIEDETIMQTQALMMTFKELAATSGEMGGMFDRATRAAADLQATGFGQMAGNAKMLGKALNDPVRGMTALTRAGVTFTQAQKDQVKAMIAVGDMAGAQEIVMGEVERQVGGVAAATATATDKIKVAFGELQESVGGAILPTIQMMATTLIPVIQSLQGPLSAVAQVVGTALAGAFHTLAPLIGPLAQTFATVAQAIAGGLLAAVQAIVPTLVPFVQMLGGFAQQMGPMVAEIFGLLGKVLGEVAIALKPLVGTLLTTLINLFKALMPSISVVAEMLVILVRSLTPVLNMLTQIIGPVAEFAAVWIQGLAPVLKAVMPMFQVLAEFMSKNMVNAMATLMVAIGFLIRAFGTIVPFIANNVSKPAIKIVGDFVVGVLEKMKGLTALVPGMSKTFDDAIKAVKSYQTDGVAAMDKAVQAIGESGSKIGQGLIDNGINVIRSGGAAMGPYAYDLGLGVAGQFAAGLDRGMQAAANRMAALAASYGKPVKPPGGDAEDPMPKGGAASGAKTDPMEDRIKERAQRIVDAYKAGVERSIGARNDLMKALSQPFPGVMSDIRKAFGSGADIDSVISSYEELTQKITDMYEPLTNAKIYGEKVAADAKANMERAKATLKAQVANAVLLRQQQQEIGKQLSQLERTYQSKVDSINSYYDQQEKAAQAAIARIEAHYKQLIDRLSKQLDKAQQAFDEANSKLQALLSERDNYLKQVGDTFRGFVNSLSFGEGDAGAGSFREVLQNRLDAVRKFNADLATLAAKGLNQSVLQDLMKAGPQQGGQLASYLAGASAEEIAGINQVQTDLAAEIASAQSFANQQWFAAGIAQQEAIVAPLKASYEQAQLALQQAQAAREAELAAAQAHLASLQAARQEALAQAAADYEKQKADLMARNDAIEADIEANAQMIEDGLLALEGTVPPSLYTTGEKSVKQMLQAFKDKYPGLKKELNDKMDELAASMTRTVTITVVTRHVSVYESSDVAGARALGGPVRANLAYVVGERGPEVFVPNTAGNIIPNNALRAGDAALAGGDVIVQPGAVQVNINGSMDNLSAERIQAVVDESMLKLAREIRRS